MLGLENKTTSLVLTSKSHNLRKIKISPPPFFSPLYLLSHPPGMARICLPYLPRKMPFRIIKTRPHGQDSMKQHFLLNYTNPDISGTICTASSGRNLAWHCRAAQQKIHPTPHAHHRKKKKKKPGRTKPRSNQHGYLG